MERTSVGKKESIFRNLGSVEKEKQRAKGSRELISAFSQQGSERRYGFRRLRSFQRGLFGEQSAGRKVRRRRFKRIVKRRDETMEEFHRAKDSTSKRVVAKGLRLN